jgi:hypothetical protein
MLKKQGQAFVAMVTKWQKIRSLNVRAFQTS